MANTLSVKQLVGKQEDFEDWMHTLEKEETPFIASIGTRKIGSDVFGWLEKGILAPELIALEDGADAIESVIRQPVTRQNVTQILARAFKVSRSAEKARKYGRKSEMAEAQVDAGILLKKSLEHSCVFTKQVMRLATPTQFAGFQAQVDPSNYIYTGGTNTPINEDALKAALLKLSNLGATPKVLMVTPEDADVVANFARDAGRYRDISDTKTIVNTVTLYTGSNGSVAVVRNHILAKDNSLVYNPRDWKLAVFDAWQTENLGKVGDSTRKMIVGEYSLQHNNSKASAVIARGTAPSA